MSMAKVAKNVPYRRRHPNSAFILNLLWDGTRPMFPTLGIDIEAEPPVSEDSPLVDILKDIRAMERDLPLVACGPPAIQIRELSRMPEPMPKIVILGDITDVEFHHRARMLIEESMLGLFPNFI